MVKVIHASYISIAATECGIEDISNVTTLEPTKDPTLYEGVPCDDCWFSYESIRKYD